MTDTIIKGSGNSRTIKTVPNIKTLVSDLDDLLDLFISGFPVDLLGPNPAGCEVIGDSLGKANILSDESADRRGLPHSAVPNDFWEMTVPPGSMFWFTSQTAPYGFLICDGAEINRENYSRLFSVIGTTFGSGDGSTTFKIPDLRAAFIRGAGSQNGYNGYFAGKQEATNMPISNSKRFLSLYSGVYSLNNPDKISSTIDTTRYITSGSSSEAYSLNYIRPFNIGLTPIIKY